MDTTPHTHTTAPPVLAARALRCRYGTFEAVRGIDLTVRRGELFALLGTNGAGKTTTLETLQGRRVPDGGHVRVLDLDPQRCRRRLAMRIGVMLQESALPNELTPAEFLALWHRLTTGGELTHRPVDDELARVGLAHRRDVRIGRLSGGERRRLDLAVALSGDPELAFLDEPTSGLDPESRADTWELIRDLRRHGSTIVLTTHYLEEAEELADRLAIMHAGHVEVSGTLHDVLAAREARIRCEVPHHAHLPRGELVGRVTAIADRDGQRLEVRTHDLTRDLAAVLAWSEMHAIPLHRLHASEPSLAEVFHDVRSITRSPEEPAS